MGDARDDESPLAHYRRVGAGRDADPHPVFASAWYRARFMGDAAPDETPLAHYLARGRAAGASPSLYFLPDWYREPRAAAVDAAGGPERHWLEAGARERARPAPVFDAAWYAATQALGPDVDPVRHYLDIGARAGATPTPAFDPAWYAEQGGPVAGDPFAHYAETGWREGLSPHPLVDPAWSLMRHPDLDRAGVEPLGHYLMSRGRDGHDPSPFFDGRAYLEANPDAAASPDAPLIHYLKIGMAGRLRPNERFGEGRDPAELIAQAKAAIRARREPPPPAKAARRLTVSAVVPNYGHARFLPERLGSILAQTRPVDEIVFLDDASADDSLSVAERLLSQAPMPVRIVANAANSGSTFRQWAKGIGLARGDLIWFAESDDSCEPELIEVLAGLVEANDGVVLAYCQSRIVDEAGATLANGYFDYTDPLSKMRWHEAYVADGFDEIGVALSRRNAIPSASAVLLARAAALAADPGYAEMRLAGDWRLYVDVLARGRAAFDPRPLNRHRRHGATVTQATRGGALAEAEAAAARRFAARALGRPSDPGPGSRLDGGPGRG